MRSLAVIALLPIAACTSVPTAEQFIPDYRGVETQLLQNDLVQFNVSMTNAITAQDVVNYAECAAAGYTLIRGFGFARHVRTSVDQEAELWLADAVYNISPALPRGLRTIDAEVVAAACDEKGIPTV
ncbi:MAG: hypothetical protein AAFY52_00245 [Pseudomonadota bacterium]